jgi:GMP synthase (glutamine-hydrolysing)
MREGEIDSVTRALRTLGVNLIVVDAAEKFLRRLKDVRDPELKRKIIGEEFVRTFEKIARKVGAEYLLQGTLYPDRIESGVMRGSDKIKTHHNVAGLPMRTKFRGIVEPLRDLYKDEVRKIAGSLRMPNNLVWRQPFPGPGLAVRIVGDVTAQKIKAVRRADAIVREEIEASGLSKQLWQYFAVLTDTKSTGVKGDSRAYGYTVAVRAVESREAMTAMFARIPYDVLEKISTRITNEVPNVVRVVYDVTHKPPSTIEWE